MKYGSFIVMLIILVLSANYTAAQERIYVSQFNPPLLHSFYFDGTDFHREDLDPDPAIQTLPGSFGALSVAATDRLFVLGLAASSLAVGIVDPQSRLEFPRPPLPFIGGPVVVSPDQSYAYSAAWQQNDSAYLTVIDLRPSSADFLQPIGSSISLGINARADSMAISA